MIGSMASADWAITTSAITMQAITMYNDDWQHGVGGLGVVLEPVTVLELFDESRRELHVPVADTSYGILVMAY